MPPTNTVASKQSGFIVAVLITVVTSFTLFLVLLLFDEVAQLTNVIHLLQDLENPR